MIQRYDTIQKKRVDASFARRYDKTKGAWVDVSFVRKYDNNLKSWVDAWNTEKEFRVVTDGLTGGGSYSPNGNQATVTFSTSGEQIGIGWWHAVSSVVRLLNPSLVGKCTSNQSAIGKQIGWAHIYDNNGEFACQTPIMNGQEFSLSYTGLSTRCDVTMLASQAGSSFPCTVNFTGFALNGVPIKFI